VIRLLLKHPRLRINQVDRPLRSGFYEACFEGHIEVVKSFIISGRDFNVGPTWDRQSVPGCTWDEGIWQRKLQIADLVDLFKSNPQSTRRKLRQERSQKEAAPYFAPIVMLCDGHLKLPSVDRTSKTKRFYAVVQRLPMELQMFMCHLLVDSSGEFITSQNTEVALKNLVKTL
jgi:hypothetical protein